MGGGGGAGTGNSSRLTPNSGGHALGVRDSAAKVKGDQGAGSAGDSDDDGSEAAAESLKFIMEQAR